MSVAAVGLVVLGVAALGATRGSSILISGFAGRRRVRRDAAVRRSPRRSTPLRGVVPDVGAPLIGLVVCVGVAGSSVLRSVLPVAVGAVVLAGVHQLRRREVDRRRRAFDDALPDYVDQLARSLRTGRTIRESLDVDPPAALSGEVAVLHRDLASGVSLGDALGRWAARSSSRGVPMVVSVLRLGHGLGGSLAGALDDCASALRNHLEVRDEIRALTSQARASAWSVALLPVGAAGLLAAVDPGVGRVLVETPLGAVCIVGALVLDGVAVWWMSRLIGEIS